MRTWKDIFSHTTDGVTRYQATVTGLRPQTEYVFSLYAENSRPPAQGPNRSETVTLIGSTTGRAGFLCFVYILLKLLPRLQMSIVHTPFENELSELTKQNCQTTEPTIY